MKVKKGDIIRLMKEEKLELNKRKIGGIIIGTNIYIFCIQDNLIFIR